VIVKIKKDIKLFGNWWESYAGSEVFFEVEESVDVDYYIVWQGQHKNCLISKSDCEIINEVTSVIPVIDEYPELDHQTTISNLSTKNEKLQAEITELKKQLPKYKIGQQVYFMDRNKICTSIICCISQTIDEDKEYYVSDSRNIKMLGNEIFETVEGLINSLKENI